MRHKVLVLFFIALTTCRPGVGQSSTFTATSAQISQSNPLTIQPVPAATPAASSTPVVAVLPPRFEPVGALGGAMKTVFVQGELAIAGAGLQLVSLDVSDPASPKPIGSLLLPQSPIDIYADQDDAYVAHAGGVSIINIADPTAPALAGGYAVPGSAIGVTGMAGASHIYVAFQRGYDAVGRNLGSGLAVVDVSNPARPLEVSSYSISGTVHAVTVSPSAGRLYAYLAEAGECRAGITERLICPGRLRILEVSDVGRPVETAVFETERIAWQVAVSAERAYVAQNQCDDEAGCRGGVAILDVSDPANPRPLGFHNRPANGLALAGSYLYLGDVVVDVSDPTASQEYGPFEVTGQVEVVVGRYLYLADLWNGALQVVDVANPISPTPIGSYDAPGPVTARSVRVAGQYAYATDDIRQGLAVIDVSDLTAPQETGFIKVEPPGKIWEIRSPYLYLGDEWLGLHIVDISKPAAPVTAGFYQPLAGQRVLAVADGYAYITTPQGWQIVDLTTPAAPKALGRYEPPGPAGWPLGAAAQAGRFYLAAYEEGWQVINWADPTAPVELGFAALPAGSPPLIAQPYAYVAAPDGMQIYDLSHPAAPARAGLYQAPGGLQKVAAVNAGLAVVVVDLKVHLVNVSNPAAPVEVGIYDGLQPVEAAALAPGPDGQLYAYLYSPAGRLDVVDVSNPASPIRLGSRTLSPNEWLSVSDILVAGRYAYLYDRLAGQPTVVMVDISNPAGPFEAGAYQAEGQVRAVRAGSGGVQAYVIDADYNLRVVDLSGPAAPQELNVYDAPENIVGLAAGETVLYLTLEAGLGQQTVQRLDLSHPAAPQALGRYESGLLGSWLMIVGDHLYLPAGRQMIRVVDVSDPARPVEVGVSPLPAATGIEQFFGAAGRVYLVIQQPGGPNSDPLWELQVVDVSDPAAPAVGGAIAPAVPALYRVLAAAGGNLYFVDRQGQLRLADVSNPAAPRDVGAALNFGPAGYIEAAELAGDELYLGLNELGLAIFRQP